MNKIFRLCPLFCWVMVVSVVMLSSCSSTPKPKLHTVEIKDMKFVPALLSVSKGDTVLWVNKDIVSHDVTEQSMKAWSSSPIPAGASWKLEILENVQYYCSIHPIMKGRLEIK